MLILPTIHVWHGEYLQMGDVAYSRTKTNGLNDAEYAGRVVGTGYDVDDDNDDEWGKTRVVFVDNTGAENTTLQTYKWPAPYPADEALLDMWNNPDNGVYEATFNQNFYPSNLSGIGTNPVSASNHLIDELIRLNPGMEQPFYNVPFKQRSSVGFRIHVRQCNNWSAVLWEACFDGAWDWMIAVSNESDHDAVEKLRKKHKGMMILTEALAVPSEEQQGVTQTAKQFTDVQANPMKLNPIPLFPATPNQVKPLSPGPARVRRSVSI